MGSHPLLKRIDELEQRWRAGERGEIEPDLVAARYLAVAALEGAQRASQLAPASDPLPLGPDGLPDIAAAQLSPSLARAAVEQYGCLIVRGLVDAEATTSLRSGIDEAMTDWRRRKTPYRCPTGSPWFSPLMVEEPARSALGRPWVTEGGGLLTADSPRVMAMVLEHYRASGVRDVVTSLLGVRPVISANKCTLRKIPVDSPTDWHQDGAFLGANLPAVNVWVTLTDCGRDAPGMDIVAARIDDIVETGTDGAHFDWAVGHARVEQLGLPIVRPKLFAGDGVIFDQMLLHRTAAEPSMTNARYAIETWSFAGTDYPAHHVPLVW